MIAIREVLPGRLILLLLFPVLISGMGIAIVYFDGFQQFRMHVKGGAVPDELFTSGRTGKELRLLEYSSLAKNDLEGFDNKLSPDEMPSTTLLRLTAAESGVPTLSISVDPEYLFNRDSGLLPNYLKRGRRWERPAYASFFEDGKLRFANGVGLRIHGGTSRASRLKSFRFYFRELYGRPVVSSGRFFDGMSSPIGSIIIHNDVRKVRNRNNSRADKFLGNWHFVNSIAYELAREIGCITPDTKPVKFYLNGEYQGPYVLKEHISDSFLTRRFGHDNFVFARMKPNKSGTTKLQKGSPEVYKEYRKWPSTVSAPMTINTVEQKIDLENLTNWMISILYVGSTDPFQGASILDETDPNARWRYINWDMDHAFMDVYDQVPLDWNIDNFTGINPILGSNTTRAIVFNRLRQESSEYRIKFLSRVVEILNHVLTAEKVAEIIARYETIANRFELDDMSFLREIALFTKHRPAALRKQLDQYFNSGRAYRLNIRNEMPMRITVDGHIIGAEYNGWYFNDTPVNIYLSTLDDTAVQKLTINGIETSIADSALTMRLSQDTDIVVR